MVSGLRRVLTFAVAALLLLLSTGSAAQAFAPAQVEPRSSYIVVFNSMIPDLTDRLELVEGFRSTFRYRSALNGFAALLTPTQAARIASLPFVAIVSADEKVQAIGPTGVVASEVPTGVRRAEAATDTKATGASTVGVAVIDTGVDLDHPDLNVVNGKNCINPTSPAGADDDNGHGSHVAGSIAARDNGTGVVGIAAGNTVYAVKVLDAAGSGTWSQVICGIDWVTANTALLNIKVANMSLGGSSRGTNYTCGESALHQAVCNSTAKGVNYVVAAGNSNQDFFFSVPANFTEVLTVTAMSDSDGRPGALGGAPTCRTGELDDRFASFSNFGDPRFPADTAHAIAGPGVCIRSTTQAGGYATFSGTSMASPHIAGLVALCFGSSGVAGPCAGLSTAGVISKLRGDAQTYNTTNTGYGFTGDPVRPVTGKYYGYLASAKSYVASAPPPGVTGLTPTSGSAAGGTAVTLAGTGFTGATAVKFGANAATFTVASDTQINATSPAGSGAVEVSVTTANGTSSGGPTFTYGPTVTGLSPSGGPIAGGTSVTISGTGFSTTATVAFGANAATNVNCTTATQCTATSPTGTAGTTDVVVTVNGLASPTSASSKFTYQPPPTVTSISPSSGPQAGGTAVTITCTNFGTTGTSVAFGAAAATNVTCAGATQCTATSPAGTGSVNVTVTTASGTSAESVTFTYLPPPSVSSVSPTSGSAAGGTAVTLAGTGFTGATAVKFGASAATGVTVTSDTQISATSPAGSGAVEVSVTTANGTSTGGPTFTYGPTVTGISPSGGPLAGGTSVTITGTGFATTAGATAVAFGANAATGVSCASATQCTATSPAGSGTVNVVVTVNGLASPTSAASAFTYTSDTTAPTISNVRITNRTETTATIAWTTNEPADSQVEFGRTTTLGSFSPLDTALVTSHSVTLTGLEPDTRYRYRVSSRDAAGNLRLSGIFGFRTRG